MSDLTLTRALRAIVVLGVVFAAVGVVAVLAAGVAIAPHLAGLTGVLSFGVVAWVVAPRQPRNAVMWSMAAFVLLVGVFPLGEGIKATYWPGVEYPAFEEPISDDLPAAFLSITHVVNALSSVGLFTLATFGILLFPDGRLLSRRWRWVAYLTATTLLVWLFSGVYAAFPGNFNFTREFFGFELAFLLLPLLALVSLFSLVLRYRRSSAESRQQIKWIIWGATVLVIATVISFNGGPELVGIVGFVALAASYGIAISRYRLYDLDVVVSKTLAYTALALFITLVYAVVVVGAGTLIGGGSDGLLLQIVATSLVAVAFEPVRHRAQLWANRLVYGQRATPYEVLSDLTTRLSSGEEGEDLLGHMAERLSDATAADRATIWLLDDRGFTVGATWPEDQPRPHEPVGELFEVRHDDSVVGAFEVVKPEGTVLSTTERSLIGDLAGSAGAVLGYQRLNDSLQAKAAELAESRARLVSVQDDERRRLERDLHDGAQQLIVALKVKIGLARTLADGQRADELRDFLVALEKEAQSALDEVRSLAKGIYPPVLESDGLASAVSGLGSSSAGDVIVSSEGVGRYQRDVEAAIYFNISEAVTNAVKHASGPIYIDLVEAHGQIRFSVRDSGPGFDVGAVNGGSGLQNLRDRIDAVGGVLEISSGDQGTTIEGMVPLQPQTSQLVAAAQV